MIPKLRRSWQVLLGSSGLALLLSSAAPSSVPLPRPKLVIVIVVDQFRPDYLERFRPFFGKTGFNLFLESGANFVEARYLHGITETCPGHAVILTGSYPNANGIIANSWYDTAAEKSEYCAADSTASLLGVSGEGRSPRNLIDSTFGDALKRSTGGRGRVITVAGKDRSAIMLGGHLADGVYWTDDTLIVSSSYYMKELPGWVRQFNSSGLVSSYLGKTWDRILPVSAYAMMGPDDVAAEADVAGLGRSFPHHLAGRFSSHRTFLRAFQTSPFENEIIAEFAMQAIIQDSLGRDEHPDLLGIGFSANDRVGHAYGPDSHEVMDVTVRTDRLLTRLFGFLEQQVGLKNLVVVLTADHGVARLPEVARRLNPGLDAWRFDPKTVVVAVETALESRFGHEAKPGWIAYHELPLIYLNVPALRRRGISMAQAENVARVAVEGVRGVQRAFTATDLAARRKLPAGSSADFSFYPARSPNVYYELKSHIVPGDRSEGTTHGSHWDYDARVPILWFGPGIKSGTYRQSVSVADIAATLSSLLGVPAPSGSQGRSLREMLR